MKTISGLTVENKDALRVSLEIVPVGSVQTIKDIRLIDKLCKLLEAEGTEVSFEDSDFEFMKKRFEGYGQWNPQFRKVIIDTADKLNG